MKKILKESGKSFLKKIGRKAVETAVETLVEEGVEAVVEIWKKRRMKIQEEYFEKRNEEDEPDVSTEGRRDYPGSSDDAPDEETARDETDDTPDSDGDEVDETPTDPAEAYAQRRRGVESLADYAERQSSD
jgi:hypothetical protein